MEQFNDVISSGQLVLADFFTTWCQPCKMMHPILLEAKAELGDAVRIVKVDVDKHEATAARYGIRSVPTLMIFRNGKLLWRQSGVLAKDDLVRIVRSYLTTSF